jgi:pyruvate formate lyase activating enzyme
LTFVVDTSTLGYPLICNFQRFCLHDGPGVRTVVFLKGCPLRCQWCANPESQLDVQELLYNPVACLGCGRCINQCPSGAISIDGSNSGGSRFSVGNVKVDHSLCTVCGSCEKVCPSSALRISGEKFTVDEVVRVILADKEYYVTSRGGVTFSGGEPLMHAGFLMKVVERLKDELVHVAVETCGYANTNVFARVIEAVDLVLFDFKVADPVIHERVTGVSNKVIIQNLAIAASTRPTVVRVPLIPGVNMSEEEVGRILTVVSRFPVIGVDLLPYHAYGLGKYEQLGRTAWQPDLNAFSDYRKIHELFEKALSIPVRLYE